MKLKWKITTASLISALLPFLIGTWIIISMSLSNGTKQAQNLLSEYAGRVGEGVSAFFSTAKSVALSASQLQGVKDMEWQRTKGNFTGFINANPSVHMMSLADSNGYVYESNSDGNPAQGGRRTENDSDPNAAPIVLTDRDYFIELVTNNKTGQQKTFVTDAYVLRGQTTKNIVSSAAVVKNGKAVGTVNVTQTAIELQRQYTSLVSDFEEVFGTEAHLLMISSAGQVVSHLMYDETNKVYNDKTLDSAEFVDVNTLNPATTEAFSTLDKTKTSMISFERDGKKFFMTKQIIDGTPFTLYLLVPQDYLLASTNAILVTSAITTVAVALILFVSIFILSSIISRPLVITEHTLNDIAKGGGDLTAHIAVSGKDEIANTGKSFNKFMDTLHGMIQKVSSSSNSMSDIAIMLEDNSTSIQKDVSSIVDSISDMNAAVEEQSASVTETSATITEITKNIESLTGQIENQSSAVTESSAAVQQMVSNINSISSNLTKASDNFDNLRNASSTGKSSISNVQDLVNNLASQSEHLLEANSVINSIASQTNLLAMNAAIEAAHAGEIGKGFSVVADEIRKLAEDSASQSKAITAELNEAVSSIQDIVKATSEADKSFDEVVSQIDSITGLIKEITLSMTEQNEGSKQVLEALGNIQDVTVQIRDGSMEMNSGTKTILNEMERLANISRQVADKSSAIAVAANAIDSSVAEISKNSEINKNAIGTLQEITGRFTL